MLIRFFKSTQPLALFILPVFALVWVAFSLFHKGNPLFVLPYGLISALFPGYSITCSVWLATLIVSLLVSVQAIYFNKLISKFDVLYKASNLPALVYVTLACLFPEFVILSPFLLINLVLLWLLHKTLMLYKSDTSLGSCFDICFLISLVCMLYFPSIILLGFFLISLSILQPFSWRDYAVSLIGFVTPWFLVITGLFLSDKQTLLTSLLNVENVKPVLIVQSLTQKSWVALGVIALLLIISLYRLRSNYYKNVIKTRNYQLTFLLLLIAGVIMILVPVNHSLSRFALLVIPLSVFISYYFLTIKKNWLAETVFVLLLMVLLYNYF